MTYIMFIAMGWIAHMIWIELVPKKPVLEFTDDDTHVINLPEGTEIDTDKL